MRVVFITCCFLLLSGTTKGSELASDVLQCLKIQQTVSRLQCYDSIAQKLQVQPVVVTEQATTTAIPAEQMPVQAHVSPQAATAPQPESQFGLKQKDPSELLGSISGKVVSVDETGLKKLEILLDNQQLWRQQDAERVDVRTGDTCIIRSGSLKSFLMECERRKKSFRVRRVD